MFALCGRVTRLDYVVYRDARNKSSYYQGANRWILRLIFVEKGSQSLTCHDECGESFCICVFWRHASMKLVICTANER